MIARAAGLGWVFVAAPLCMGLPIARRMGEKRSLSNIYLAGFFAGWALFQTIAVPIVIFDAWGADLLFRGMTALLILLSLPGLALAAKERFREKKSLRRILGLPGLGEDGAAQGERSVRALLCGVDWECVLFWGIALAAIAAQVFMAYTHAFFDGDDAYYVVQSVLADQTGTLYRIRPYTGLSTGLDLRHSLATLPLWEAYVARMGHMHATIAAHSLLPLILLPLTYLVYYKIGCQLPGMAGPRLPMFLTLIAILQIWGNNSIYTNATFLLTRTWQGKSILANLVLLSIVWLLLDILKEKDGDRKGDWALLFLVNMSSAMMTSMGAFLAALLVGVVGLVASIRMRKGSLLLRFGLCCAPNVFYLGLLLAMGGV